MSAEYDTVANQYDVSFTSMPYRIYIEEWSVLDVLGDVSGKSVLELACGTGHYARRLRQRGAARVVAVDLSPEMIEVARAQEAQQSLGITYHVQDVASLDLGETFDTVLAVYLLHYAPDRASLDRMTQAIARHLQPGGSFVTYQLNPDIVPDPEYYKPYGLKVNSHDQLRDGDTFSFHFSLIDSWSAPITIHYWSEATLTESLQQAGLSSVTWINPTLTPGETGSYDRSHWDAYLRHPHCRLISASKAAD
jgi:toxoflavin synthase